MPQPVFRFAPSPTGYLHIGHALSALLNSREAERTGGRFLLRIEDIDLGRRRPEFVAAIYEDLRWLGLEWEDPVRIQSEHMGDYAMRITQLQDNGLLYPCFCTRKDIANHARDTDPDSAPLYPGTCRNLSPDQIRRAIDSGQPYVLRLNMTAALECVTQPLTFCEIDLEDGSQKTVLCAPEQWGDVVLRRKDIPTSYHLSVVHDDALQGITHIVRGRDLYRATDIHRLLQALFDLPAPDYSHHRLILDEAGLKYAKRTGAPALRELRADGITPEDIRTRLGI